MTYLKLKKCWYGIKARRFSEKWMNICFHYKKMGDDLNIKEKEEHEKLKDEAEIRGKNMKLN